MVSTFFGAGAVAAVEPLDGSEGCSFCRHPTIENSEQATLAAMEHVTRGFVGMGVSG
jgi:hypothetical protein